MRHPRNSSQLELEKHKALWGEKAQGSRLRVRRFGLTAGLGNES